MKGLGMRVMWVEVGTARVREISSGEATEELWGRGGEGRGQRQKPRDILMLRGQTKKGDLRKQSGKEPSCYQQSVMMLSAVRHVISSPSCFQQSVVGLVVWGLGQQKIQSGRGHHQSVEIRLALAPTTFTG